MRRLQRFALVASMRAVQRLDRLRLAALQSRLPGLSIDPGAASAFAVSHFHLEPGARVRLERGVVTERRPGGVIINVRAGGELVIREGTWLRSELGPVTIHVYPGARCEIGPRCFLNGCQLSAKAGVTLGRQTWVGPGSRIWDSDQHPLDADTPERSEPVVLGDYVWVAADVSVLRGVAIGSHSIVGTRSLVTSSIPPHTLAFGQPARPRGQVGDRSTVSI